MLFSFFFLLQLRSSCTVTSRWEREKLNAQRTGENTIWPWRRDSKMLLPSGPIRTTIAFWCEFDKRVLIHSDSNSSSRLYSRLRSVEISDVCPPSSSSFDFGYIWSLPRLDSFPYCMGMKEKMTRRNIPQNNSPMVVVVGKVKEAANGRKKSSSSVGCECFSPTLAPNQTKFTSHRYTHTHTRWGKKKTNGVCSGAR